MNPRLLFGTNPMAPVAPPAKPQKAGIAYILQGPFDKPLLLYGLESLVLATSFTAGASTLLDAFEVPNAVRFPVLPPIFLGLALMWLVLRIRSPTVEVGQAKVAPVPAKSVKRPAAKRRKNRRR
ncbi:MAG: hypothetical protein Q8P02_01480 [Candidatus Micrarchaeota archaeon]|nr:hypothetical protein [Candidatus Micrarchaeota archaeon]